MAGILKHRYVNPHADVAGSTKTQASHWNDFLVATGGVHGDSLTRDTSDATYGMAWKAGGGVGFWQNVPFNAANFAAASPMTLTVSAAGVPQNSYTRIGNVVIWQLVLGSANAVLGGTAGNRLNLTIPTGLSMVGTNYQAVIQCICGGTDTRALALFVDDATKLAVFRVPTTNFVLGGLDFAITAILQVA